MDDERYLAARTVSDVWICYPWEATYTYTTFVPQAKMANMLVVILMNMIDWQRPKPNTRFLLDWITICRFSIHSIGL